MRFRLRTRACGFSLTETLVVVGLTGVLLSITLPSLGQARYAARESACLASIRDVGVQTFSYASDHRGRLPHPGGSRLDNAFENAGRPASYFSWKAYWTVALAPRLDSGALRESVACPFTPGGASRLVRSETGDVYPAGFTYPSGYWLSTALFTNWRPWAEGSERAVDASQRRPVGTAEVVFPSSKVLHHEALPHHDPMLEQMRSGAHDELGRFLDSHSVVNSRCDGSAFISPASDLPKAVSYPGEWVDPLDEDREASSRLVNTRDGFRGADFGG